MSNKQKMVVTVTNGVDDERASVAWSVANGGIGMGFDVTMFLAGPGVDWVRRGAADNARLNPLDPPMIDMINFVDPRTGRVIQEGESNPRVHSVLLFNLEEITGKYFHTDVQQWKQYWE